jgi:RNA-directed DNA polymerase
MTAPFDPHLPAAPPSPVASARPGAARSAAERRSPSARTPEQAARLAAKRARADRPSGRAIQDAGGIAAWVRAELGEQGSLHRRPRPERPLGPAKRRLQGEEARRGRGPKRPQAPRVGRPTARRTSPTSAASTGTTTQSPDKLDVDGREERARDNRPHGSRQRRQALAKALGLTISRLRWLTYHREVDTGTHYRRWQIPKRDGSMRTITGAQGHLKAAQRWALRNVWDKLPVHGAAHGFLTARSIVTNARAHAGSPMVIVKIDIKDFFPTITFRRVKGLLRKAGLPEERRHAPRDSSPPSPPRGHRRLTAARPLRRLGPARPPPGRPTSPQITNALCRRMDRRLSGLARLPRHALHPLRRRSHLLLALPFGGRPQVWRHEVWRHQVWRHQVWRHEVRRRRPRRRPASSSRAPIGVLLRGATSHPQAPRASASTSPEDPRHARRGAPGRHGPRGQSRPRRSRPPASPATSSASSAPPSRTASSAAPAKAPRRPSPSSRAWPPSSTWPIPAKGRALPRQAWPPSKKPKKQAPPSAPPPDSPPPPTPLHPDFLGARQSSTIHRRLFTASP